ncbi:MAG: ATP-binding protein [Anaeromyxobacteraceae bacterium]
MRRKIILGLVLHTLVFLVAGLYLASKIRIATEDVDRVIRQHQVELLREGFLLRLKQTQADLLLRGSPPARPVPADAGDVTRLQDAIDGCFGCHHAPRVTEQLASLRQQTVSYRAALAAVPADAGEDVGPARLQAYEIGDHLVLQVRTMVDTTQALLTEHTLRALDDIARTKYVVYALVVFGPLLSVLVGLVAVTGLTNPLDALLEATRRLKHGDLDHRVLGLRDEFAELAQSFNDMAGSLQEQMQLMQRTEQLVVVGELAAGLVHEIKNPLAGIKAAMQVLVHEAKLSGEDRAVLEKVAREVVGLEGMLRAFLDFARPARPQLASVDVNTFVETVASFYLRSHVDRAERPLRLARTLGQVPAIRADPRQLQQILLNLLLNAADAMPDGGQVEVRTSYDATRGEVQVAIVDGGRGISPEHAPHVFQPFFTTKPGGTGLGLAVSKRLAEQQGGSLSFAPGAAGGTVFQLHLPADAPPARRSA